MSNKIESEVNGISLFTEIKDKELQLRNRASILVNIIESFAKNEEASKEMTIETLQYWSAIPESERAGLNGMILRLIAERGENRWNRAGDRG